MTNYEHLAREGYHHYGQVTDFKNFRGEPMPEFDDLPPKIQEAWAQAAYGIVNACGGY